MRIKSHIVPRKNLSKTALTALAGAMHRLLTKAPFEFEVQYNEDELNDLKCGKYHTTISFSFISSSALVSLRAAHYFKEHVPCKLIKELCISKTTWKWKKGNFMTANQ